MDFQNLRGLADLGGTLALAVYAVWTGFKRNEESLKREAANAEALESIIGRLLTTLDEHAKRMAELTTTVRGCPYYSSPNPTRERDER